MTTNYLTLELTSKMEHQERLRKAEQLQQLESLTCSASMIGQNWLYQLRDLIRNYFVIQQHPTQDQPIQNQPDHLQPASQSIANSRTVATAMLSMTEEEWMLLFRMVKNRKLSVDQAAQLLVAMN